MADTTPTAVTAASSGRLAAAAAGVKHAALHAAAAGAAVGAAAGTVAVAALPLVLIAGIGTLLVLVVVVLVTTSAASGGGSSRQYQGTAPVGDFWQVTVDPAASTIAYTNNAISSGGEFRSGTVAYTAGAAGALATSDANILGAVEVPGTALLMNVAHAGPRGDAPSLVVGVERGAFVAANAQGKTFNFMQFRTSNGGGGVGAATISSDGSLAALTYSPSSRDTSGLDAQGIFVQSNVDSGGTFLSVQDGGGDGATAFMTASGLVVVDNPNGAILLMPQASATAFAAAAAGTYKGLYYGKKAAEGGQSSESGTVTQGSVTVTLDAYGAVSLAPSDSAATNATVASATLSAFTSSADAGGGVADALRGATWPGQLWARVADDTRLFVCLHEGALFFLVYVSGTPYSYSYGVAMKQ